MALRNVDGSFVDFRAERYDGTSRQVLTEPPDAWGGRAAIAWAEQLADDSGYDPDIEEYLPVADVIDAIYDRSLSFTKPSEQAMADQQSKTTTDHETIRQWAEARGGVPATIRRTEKGDEPGVLRIHFPNRGEDDKTFDEINWDTFFDKFEENDLAFLYQEETDEGKKSRFFKLVSRD